MGPPLNEPQSNGEVGWGGTEGCGEVLWEHSRWNGGIWEVKEPEHSRQKAKRWGPRGVQEGQGCSV